ncbi:MAG: molybdenum cofactor biosynthesis protein MoaE [Chloroflexota bacterium]
MIQVTKETVLLQRVLDSLKTDTSGSVVTHTAIIRPSSEGKRVVSIEYQANKTEAEEELQQIASEIGTELEIQDISLYRRLGKLKVGDAILIAAVAAPHRKEAFQACAEAVERMRGMTSVSKREIYE